MKIDWVTVPQLFGCNQLIPAFFCFSKDVILPSQETKRGYRHGIFTFYDLMGNPVGKMTMVIRLSCLGAALLPHLRMLPDLETTTAQYMNSIATKTSANRNNDNKNSCS